MTQRGEMSAQKHSDSHRVRVAIELSIMGKCVYRKSVDVEVGPAVNALNLLPFSLVGKVWYPGKNLKRAPCWEKA